MRVRLIGSLFLTLLFLSSVHYTTDACGQEIGLGGLSKRGTINVTELSPAAQRESLQLQQAGLEAFRHAKYGDADKLLRQALELTPSSYVIYNNLGVNSARSLQLNEAARWLEKAQAMAPFDPVVTGNLGVVFWLQNRVDESYELLQKALDRGYTLAIAHYAIGLMALQKQHPLDAVRHLSKADCRIFPYRDLYLSMALQQMGKADSAAKRLRRFLRGCPAPWFLAAYSMQ